MHVTEISSILAKYPEWDRAPRRFHLKPITNATKNTDDLMQEHDHINPASWTGDVNMQNVVLATCWKLGHETAETILSNLDSGTVESLEKVKEAHNNILQPFGALITKYMGDETNEDDVTEVDRSQDSMHSPSILAGLVDIEDEATVANFEEHDDALSDQSTNMHQPYVMMGNKKAYKGCLFKAYFTTKAGSTDHIKRVAGAGKYEESTNADVYHDTISDSVLGHPALFLGDPATTLV